MRCRAGMLALLVAGATSGCSGSPPTHMCAGSDEVFQGEESPCPATGVLRGVVRDQEGNPPDEPVTVMLHAAGHVIRPKKTDVDGRFTFNVGPDEYRATATAFEEVRCAGGPVRVRRNQVAPLVVVICTRTPVDG
jgi:hypothetical protein